MSSTGVVAPCFSNGEAENPATVELHLSKVGAEPPAPDREVTARKGRRPLSSAEPGVTRLVARQVRHLPRPVGSLMSWVLDRRNLDAAWERVSSNPGANTPGPDGVTCGDIGRHLNNWLSQLADDLRREEFQPRPPRWIDIPKSSEAGATRRIGVLTVADRVVHQTLKQVLEPVLEPAFSDDSFGFRPGRSVPGALHAATRALSFAIDSAAPFSIAVKLDIANCFPSIDHQELFQEFDRHVADPDLRRLLERLCEAGGATVRRLWSSRQVGLVQGSGLSPLLCNLFLHRLDETVAEWSRAGARSVRLLRYADDLLLLAKDLGTARAASRLVRETAGRLRLGLRESKSELRSVRDGFRWLGVFVQPRAGTWTGRVEYGYHIPDDKAAAMLAALDEMTRPPCDRISGDAVRLSRWLASINEQLRQWRAAYLLADNAPRVFAAIDERARVCVRQLLYHTTKQRGQQLDAAFRVRLPRGFWTWEAEGVRLVNLSSLAPRAPFFHRRHRT